MNNYLISPEDCLILRAFKDVHSLREAAKILGCDPAGLLRKTQRISDEHGFLQKINGRWSLTSAGRVMVGWVEESIAEQRKLLQDQSMIRICSTMWFSEQVIIPNILKLKKSLGSKTQFQMTTPEKGFELELIEGGADFVIVCHPPQDPAIAHKQIFKEEWIVIAPVTYAKKIKMSELWDRPFIRHAQLNPDVFQLEIPTSNNPNSFQVDSLITVRSAVLHGLGWSIVPKILVHDLIKQKKLLEIDFDINMDRKVCVWWLRSRVESKKHSLKVCSWIQESCMNL